MATYLANIAVHQLRATEMGVVSMLSLLTPSRLFGVPNVCSAQYLGTFACVIDSHSKHTLRVFGGQGPSSGGALRRC